MILKRRVALNGIWLDEIDRRIVITSVEPADGRENISAVDTAAGYGQRVTGNRRSNLDMVVKFRLLEHGHSENGLTERGQLLEQVNAWAAGGGWLTVNYKPDRRLGVILVQAPGEGSLWDYTKEFQITFRAYSVPYWEDENALSVESAGITSFTRTIVIPGSAKTPLNVKFKNTSGSSADTFSISAGGKSISFSSLGLANGETLIIDADGNGVFRARILSTGNAYRSVLGKRTAASSDDLLIAPGSVSVSMTAQKSGTLTIAYRGRYL